MFDIDIEVVNNEELNELTGEIITSIKMISGVKKAEQVDSDIVESPESSE